MLVTGNVKQCMVGFCAIKPVSKRRGAYGAKTAGSI